jgi:hypothetical protein
LTNTRLPDDLIPFVLRKLNDRENRRACKRNRGRKLGMVGAALAAGVVSSACSGPCSPYYLHPSSAPLAASSGLVICRHAGGAGYLDFDHAFWSTPPGLSCFNESPLKVTLVGAQQAVVTNSAGQIFTVMKGPDAAEVSCAD